MSGFLAQEKTDDGSNARDHPPYETYSSFFSPVRKKKKKRNLAERLIKGRRALSVKYAVADRQGWLAALAGNRLDG